MTSTQDCLLNAAETLLIEKGFAATSLRAIATRARANLAAAHYHFGSKQGLLEALVHRRMTPINQARLQGLNEILAADSPPTPRQVLETFLRPIVESDDTEHLPALIGRIYSEPPSIMRPLLEREFGEVAAAFQAALADLLPALSVQEIRWRFHFLIGGMLQTLTVPQPLGEQETPLDLNEKFGQLIDFAVAGFSAPPRQTGE